MLGITNNLIEKWVSYIALIGRSECVIACGAILGGKIWADEDLNTPANIQAGKVFFSFDFTPPTPAEHITFKSILTNNYLEEIV